MPDIKEFFANRGFNIKLLDLYELALTHPSSNVDGKGNHKDYERLEFIGDAVLELVCSDLIYKIHPELEEGKMSVLRSSIVRSSSLSDYGRQMGLHNYIHTAKSLTAEQVFNSNKIIEDVFEALVGALYLDLGYDGAFKYLEKIIVQDIVNVKESAYSNPKNTLQELFQGIYKTSVSYNLVSKEGPDHDPTFTVEVIYNNIVLGRGTGKSKKEAEENAAQEALDKRSF